MWEMEDELDYETRQLYMQSLTTVRIIEENIQLKRENERLRKRVAKFDRMVDEQLQSNNQWAGNLLGALIKKEEKTF